MKKQLTITKEWLKSKNACSSDYKWSLEQKGFDKGGQGMEVVKFLKLLVKDDHWQWANWGIVRIMTRPQYLRYAIYSAEQVIGIYEKKYPFNKAPREAIDAAKDVLENDTQKNRDRAYKKRAAAAEAAEARIKMRMKILNYGIDLLKEKNND